MLSDEDYRALQEQVHLLQELKQQPGWQELLAAAHELMTPYKKTLLNGQCKSHEDYLKASWMCVGIHKILDMADARLRVLEDEQGQRVEKDVPLT